MKNIQNNNNNNDNNNNNNNNTHKTITQHKKLRDSVICLRQWSCGDLLFLGKNIRCGSIVSLSLSKHKLNPNMKQWYLYPAQLLIHESFDMDQKISYENLSTFTSSWSDHNSNQTQN